MPALSPSLTAAVLAVPDSLPPGERVDDVTGNRDLGCVWLLTDTAHEHGITIYGYSDGEG